MYSEAISMAINVRDVGLPCVAVSLKTTATGRVVATEECIEGEETVYSIRNLCRHVSCRSRHRNATPQRLKQVRV